MNLPSKGLSLFPIWLQLILKAGKRIECRPKNVAAQVGDYQGPVLLTATIAHSVPQYHPDGPPVFAREYVNGESANPWPWYADSPCVDVDDGDDGEVG